jgi:hypothetical protein
MRTAIITIGQVLLLLFGVACGLLLIISPAKAITLHNRYWQRPQQWWPDSIAKWYAPSLVKRSPLMAIQYRFFGSVLLTATGWGLYSLLWNR